MEKVDILILGTGPTGLGAATRLNQLGHEDWLIIDQAPEAGGLACTDITPEGFLFDMGGHVIFSHWEYFDQLLNAALGEGPEAWNTLQRVSYVWIKDRWVAYPFQNNISALPKEDQIKCLTGLVDAKVVNTVAKSKPTSFDEWILRVMGPGIADVFMRPYNFKVWAVPTTMMQCNWLGERVATVDVNRAISNVINGKEDAGWGPNAVFRFPTHGGTGAIWKGVARLLPEKNQRYNCTVTGIDKEAKVVTLESGAQIRYNSLLSTLPLDVMLRWFGKQEWADKLQHSSSHIIGLGIRGKCPHGSKCWLYYPEDNCPYYRCTIFSNYAKANCPDDGKALPTLCMADGSEPSNPDSREGPYWSLMFEVSESQFKPLAQHPVKLGGTAGTWTAVVKETMLGAIATKLVNPGDEIVSIYHRRIEHGYPTPTLGRDAVLEQALPWLRKHGIWSRGRFGSYKYEVANQDHSLMLGVEAADNIKFGSKELTLNHPDIVNSKKNDELLFKKKK
uniref:Amine oxidase domain-containing protein n=1 Tax=Dunaliella tertiolecta TaxID=3047 RepID=A0A7S3R1H1_DUNTE|mmetsp:Transcript_4213/g.11362  ORF Transcript_4213/g.11362 Transcript_4213/m.11362 type:complete len:504 (+) Transcript_4213:56-1567(+)